MRIGKNVLIGLMVCVFIFPVSAQENFKGYEFGALVSKGFLISHRKSLDLIRKDHTSGFEIFAEKRLSGTSFWHQKFRYPKIGISGAYNYLGNPQELGNGYALFLYIDFPFVAGEKLSYNLKFGQGLGWIENPFDRVENFKNLGISSHLNGYIQFYNHLDFKLNDHISGQVGISFVHFSNGSSKTPNLGINICSINAGVSYGIQPVAKQIQEDSASHYDFSKWERLVVVSGASKEKKPIGGDKYAAFSASFTNQKNVSFKSMLGWGVDLFYDASVKAELEETESNVSNAEILQPGIHGSYVLKMNRFYFLIQMGFYVYTKYTGDGSIYHRIGNRYQLTEHLLLNLSLKSHFAVADHFEFGVGYRL